MLKHRMYLFAFVCLASWFRPVMAQHVGQAQQPAQQTVAVAEPEAPRVVLQAETTASVLRLMKFSGLLRDRAGNPPIGVLGITFDIYKDQHGGTALWLETQNAQLDEQGRYTVLLGSTRSDGLPLELFSSGEARWLGVQVNLPGEEEQPRVLLVSVPYALKAADAETLGGKPPSAFLLADPVGADLRVRPEAGKAESAKEAAKSGPDRQMVISGTPGKIAKFVGPNPDDVGNSIITESGGNIGVDNPSPTAKLDVGGGFQVAAFRGSGSDAVVTVQNTALSGGSWDLVATGGGSGVGGGKFSIARTGVAHYLTIDSSGRVGINQPNPGFRLDVNGIVGVNGTLTMNPAGPSNNIIEGVGGLTAGAVAVGRNFTPGLKLDVLGPARFEVAGPDAFINLLNSGAGGNSWDIVATGNGSLAGAGKFSIARTGIAHLLTIDGGTGNVGIGNTTPMAKLDVDGSLKVNGSVTIPAATRVLSIPCAAFAPLNNTLGFNRCSGNGEVEGTTASQTARFDAPVFLPNGATITQIQVVVKDNDGAGNISVSLDKGGLGAAFSNLASVSSSGTPGVTTLTTPVSHTVDNSTGSYSMSASWTVPATPANLAVYSARITYTITTPLP